MPTTPIRIIHDPTTTINNIMDTVGDMVKETSTLLDSLGVTDYTNAYDPTEWQPLTLTHDKRYDAVDVAYTAMRDAMTALAAAFNHSVNIDNS